jgi:hypothetical protein
MSGASAFGMVTHFPVLPQSGFCAAYRKLSWNLHRVLYLLPGCQPLRKAVYLTLHFALYTVGMVFKQNFFKKQQHIFLGERIWGNSLAAVAVLVPPLVVVFLKYLTYLTYLRQSVSV